MDKGISPEDFVKSVKNRNLNPYYMTIGDELYWLDLVTREAREKIIDESMRDFNLDVFYGDDVTASQIASSLSALPMMSDLRCIVLKHAESVSPTVQSILEKYTENPAPDVILLLVYEGIPKAKWAKNISNSKKVTIIDCASPRKQALIKWIKASCKKRKIEIEDEALELIVGNPGIRLVDVDEILEKAELLTGEGGTLDVETLQLIWGIEPDVNIWSFFDKVASGRRKIALSDVENMRTDIEKDLGFFVSQIGRRLRLVWKEQSYNYHRTPYSQRKWSGSTEFQWKKASQPLKTLPSKVANGAISDLIEFEQIRKSKSVDSVILFENLLHKIALRRERAK